MLSNRLFYNNFSGGARAADLMSGADGALSINGTTVNIAAGSIKRYSSISIINNGQLVIQGFSTYGTGNPGHLPTLIGCSGNCTINTGGKIVATDNAGDPDDFYGSVSYSALTVPFDSAVNPVSYTREGGGGGAGGETGGYGTIYGSDVAHGLGPYNTGHGGGGAGYVDGGNTTDAEDWGVSGAGADSSEFPGQAGLSFGNAPGSTGNIGIGGENGGGVSVGGGGSGGVRGLSGGAVYLQIAGTATIDANTIDVRGSNGGNGGDGGIAESPDDAEYGGGGGGGACGGSGGYVWIRYKTGSVNASAAQVTGGVGGIGGVGGLGDNPGTNGLSASDGTIGGSSIATY